MATKALGSARVGVGQRRMTALAVRKPRTEECAKVLRICFAAPPGVTIALNNWIAEPNLNV